MVGGTEQVFSDASSIAKYGKRTLSTSGLLNATDADVNARSYFQLSNYKSPQIRTESLTIKPGIDPATLYPYVLGFDLGRRITLQLTQASINEDYVIEGVNLDWQATQPQALSCKWQLSNYTNANFPVPTVDRVYPNGAGYITQMHPSASSAGSNAAPNPAVNYQYAGAVGGGTVWVVTAETLTDYYAVTDLAAVGRVYKIVVYWYGDCMNGQDIYLGLLLAGANPVSDIIPISGYYLGPHAYSWTFNITSEVTLAQINAMQIGHTMLELNTSGGLYCDCLYADIYHYL